MKLNDITIEFIIDWCKENKQVAWLKATAAKQMPQKVYPTIVVDGKKQKDKAAEPTEVMKPITFIQIRSEFVKAFMPDLMPKKEKKATMYDMIAAL